MAIEPYVGEHTAMRFATYDLEWYPGTLQVRLVGCYDGVQYRSFRTVEQFLDFALRSDMAHLVWFAHNGGCADVQFLLEKIIESGRYGFEASFCGSSAVTLRVMRGRRRWLFCDSLFLLRGSLASIAKSMGKKKGDDYRCSCFPACGHVEKKGGGSTCVFYAPDDILREYNRLDCVLLYEAIERMQDFFLSMGSSMKRTAASSALHLFRSKFLKRTIPTSDEINARVRPAYVASRVEVYRPFCEVGNSYDVNSSFPASMMRPQPGRLLEVSRTLPPKNPYLARCKVRVPDCYVPPLPRKAGGRVIFPVGEWEGWYSRPLLESLEECGGSIVEVLECLEFEPFSDMADYVSECYALKAEAKDPFLRNSYKMLLNSLYGKFGESPEKEYLASKRSEDMIFPGVFRHVTMADVPCQWVPISSYITSNSIAILTRGLREAASQGEVYYCDTDSVKTTSVLSDVDDKRLGAWKFEGVIRNARFVAPKLYDYCDDKGVRHLRAKGFSRLTPSEFDDILNGGAHIEDRMLRLRELYRSGRTTPREERREKRLIGALPKRVAEKGDTRPWTVEELEFVEARARGR